MAFEAPSVIRCRGFATGRVVRVVTSQTGKHPTAVAEAGALRQVNGLVADVPGIIPIDSDSVRSGRTMTPAAEFVELRRGKARWIPHMVPLRILRVSGAGPVAGLAVHTRFRQSNLAARRE